MATSKKETILHHLTTNDRTTADLACQNLRELTPLVVEISQVMPLIVVAEVGQQQAEVGQQHEGVDPAVATDAVRTTHAAWRPETAKTTARTAPPARR